MGSIERHQEEILFNQQQWNNKPVLRRIYKSFHARLANHLPVSVNGAIMEIGSGVADITEVIPGCLRTDLFPNPWIDQVENAYALSLADQSVAGIILFDVFHHLRYPGTALKEFQRVLKPRGRVIIFEPGLSLLGNLVYGPLHPEPLGSQDPISWLAPEWWSPEEIDYYAAQGNANRIFLREEVDYSRAGWKLTAIEQYADISYVASGGYSKPQLYPDFLYPVMRLVDQAFNLFPRLFATRLLVVLEKT